MALVVRGDNLSHSMSDYLIKEIGATPAVTVQLETEVIDGHGGDRLDGLTLRGKRSGRAERAASDGSTAVRVAHEYLVAEPGRVGPSTIDHEGSG